MKDGKDCVFRVVRVSGTIRKAEEEAIRRAKEIMVKAKRELGEQGESTLDNIFGKAAEADSARDIMMVDTSDSEDDHGANSDDGDG